MDIAFQYHYGAIKSSAHDLGKRFSLNFNTTMVRLKAIFSFTPGQSPNYFNTTMVRLKADTTAGGADDETEFQYHYGAIKRQLVVARLGFRPHFNTTMVRLKEIGRIKE